MADEANGGTVLGTPGAGDPPPANTPPAGDPPPTNTSPADPAKAGEGKEPEKPAGPPEKYEDFKVSEGYTLDPKVVEQAAPLFKELGLTQEGAQKLIDLQTKLNQEATEAMQNQWTELRSGWVKTAREDKEIGGDKFEANVAIAKKAIEKLGTPALMEALNQTGVGDHPEFIRLFYKIGTLVADDKLHFGSPSGGAPKSAAERLYGNSSA